jgi:RNA polymerase sigma factor (sigma-70 family)
MTREVHRLLRHLRQTVLWDDRSTDGLLLRRYLDEGDAAAFAALVRRHGAMVLGVCRRVLGHEQDAEDAFQATFLVLARKAASIDSSRAVGSWLYGVAYRAALKAREAASRRRARERAAGQRRVEEWPALLECHEDLDREIARLPEVYRTAVVLCELQGLSRKEAARQLGCPEGTLSSRLAKARRLLAGRLGAPASIAALAAAGGTAGAAPTLIAGTLRVAMGGPVADEVASLTQGVINAMWIAKFRGVVALLLVACSLAAGVTALALSAREERKAEDKMEEVKPSGPLEAVAVRRFEGHTDGVMVVAFSPDGKRALSGGVCYGDGDPTVRLWDLSNGKELLKLEGHTSGVYGVAFLPGGKKAVSGSDDKTIRLWDLESGKELKRFEGHDSCVYGLAVSPDGKYLLSGGEDKTIRLWDIESGNEVRRFEGHTDKVRAVAFSPDGKKAVSGGLFEDPSIRVWEVESGNELSKYTVEPDGVASVAFSPDGKFVLAGGVDGVVHVWELSNGNERRLEGHSKQIHGAVFTPDGKRILSASYDQTVRLWDVAEGKEVCRFWGHTNWAWGVAVSRDGKYGLSGSLDKTMRLWKLPK